MEALSYTHWVILSIGSLIMGMSKGGLPGAGNLTVAMYALVLEDAIGLVGVPLSVGLLLPVLIAADLTATLVYRKHTAWKFIFRLLPCFIVGTVFGWWIFDYFQEGDGRVRQLKYVIGAILLSMTVLHFLVKIRKHDKAQDSRAENNRQGSIILGLFFGLLGGVATMLANAAGPIAQLYLLAMALPKYAFIGTSAWLFLIVNVIKVPFMVDLGIITMDSMSVSCWMFIPAVIGACVAPFIVKYINQSLFEKLVWFFIVLAGLRMIL